MFFTVVTEILLLYIYKSLPSLKVPVPHYSLIICYYDDKHAQSPSYTIGNAINHILRDFNQWRRKGLLLHQSLPPNFVIRFQLNISCICLLFTVCGSPFKELLLAAVMEQWIRRMPLV